MTLMEQHYHYVSHIKIRKPAEALFLFIIQLLTKILRAFVKWRNQDRTKPNYRFPPVKDHEETHGMR